MKNIILIIFALVLGVAEAWGQGIQTFTAGRWQSPSVEGSTNSIPIAVQDNAVVFYRVNHGVTVNISATSGGANINASGRTGAQPAIFLPESATLVITGDGTINLTGGNYYFDIALFDKTATVPIDYKSKIKTFFVKMDYIAEGIVVLNHSWKVK